MAGIVVIHGIGQQLEGPSTLSARFFPALRDGMSRAGTDISPDDVAFASYGELFRPKSEFLAPEPYYDASDVEPGFEEDLLMAIWERPMTCRDVTVRRLAHRRFRPGFPRPTAGGPARRPQPLPSGWTAGPGRRARSPRRWPASWRSRSARRAGRTGQG